MSASQSYGDHLLEILAPMGAVRLRRMFGGAGLFLEDLMFGLIADEVLYFKVDDINRPAFAAENCAAFTYQRKSGPGVVMSYVRAPERLFDEPEELLAWARDAHGAARRNAKPKKKRVAKKSAAKKMAKKKKPAKAKLKAKTRAKPLA